MLRLECELAKLLRRIASGLAGLAGIASSYLSHIERGEHVPSLTIILKLSLALQILPDDLLSDFTSSAMKKLRLNE